ncbi:SH3 domain-containing protein [bacterium]|nr:SH3 domain-containing protein [bacterium]
MGISVGARAADGPYYIHATEVNLRESPNGEIILVFDVNDKVFIVEKQGNWCYVSAPGREAKGWCWSEFIGEGRVDGPESEAAATPAGEQVCAQPEDDSVTLIQAPPAPHEAAAVPALTQTGGDVLIEDAQVADGAPISVLEAKPGEAPQLLNTTIDDVPRTEPATATAAADPGNAQLSVFSYDPQGEFGTISQASVAASPGFIPDEQGEDWRPPAQPATDQETGAPFYQPFESNPRVTTPGMLESAFYKPVGGHDLALIKGDNVNVRDDKSLKSKVIGSVDTGDKLYVLGHEDPWYHVSIPAKNLKGYVYGQYVDQLKRVEITGDQVRLREKPSLDGRIKTELDHGEVFFEFDRQGSWVLVASSASGIKGWVHSDYLCSTERSASRPYVVRGDAINFRASPNVDADIITALNDGTPVQVSGRNEKWSFIEFNGQQGWMYSQYLVPAEGSRGLVVPASPVGERLIARAKAMSGTPYVWGGESDSGVDCSGLIYKLLLDEGADARGLPRRASTQMAQLGAVVDKEDLAPGDLVFFTTYKAGASHVGIYLGDGDFIHASSAQGKVTISNMSDGYYKRRFVGARRISEAELRGLQ